MIIFLQLFDESLKRKGKRDSELEFIVDGNGVAVPFDVKKKKGSLSSLQEFRAHNKKALAVKVSSNQFGYDAEKKTSNPAVLLRSVLPRRPAKR